MLEDLQRSQLTDEQLALLRPVHQRGATATKKQKLRHALKLQRMGMEAPDDARLFQVCLFYDKYNGTMRNAE